MNELSKFIRRAGLLQKQNLTKEEFWEVLSMSQSDRAHVQGYLNFLKFLEKEVDDSYEKSWPIIPKERK